MVAQIDLGNYEIDEDGNGDLIIKDPADNTVLTWDDTNGKWVMASNAPLDVAELIDGAGTSHTGELEDINHGGKHENGGADEISVAGLSGDLADEQDPKPHASEHEAGGPDTLTIGNLVNFDPVAVLIDTEANKPAAGTADRVFIAQDTGDIQRDNGSTWDVVATTNIADTDHVAADHENGGSLEIDVTGLSGDLADAQDPKAHTTSHQDGGSDELVVETLPANSTNTDVVFSPDGTGGVTTKSVGGNVPEWQEDANSPLSFTGATSGTITLDGTYDAVKCIIVDSSNDNISADLQINGDTGTNYTVINLAGSRTSGLSSFERCYNPQNSQGMEINMSGSWSGNWTAEAHLAGNGTGAGHVCANTNVTSPLDSITFVDDLGTAHDLTVKVYGLSQ